MALFAIVILLIGFSTDANSTSNYPAARDGCASQAWRENFVGARVFWSQMKLISLSNSTKKVMVDDEDFNLLDEMTWQLTTKSMVVSWVNVYGKNKCIIMARVIMNAPKGVEVDHRFQNRLDQRKENLRFATRRENARNKPAPNVASKPTKFKGVTLERRFGVKNRWQARICVDGKTFHLGMFSTDVEAAKRYNEAAQTFHGEFACLNPV